MHSYSRRRRAAPADPSRLTMQTAEREEKKAKKLAAENEKKAKEDKKKAVSFGRSSAASCENALTPSRGPQEISKQSGFLNGFFKKKSASPAPTSAAFAAAAGAPPSPSSSADHPAHSAILRHSWWEQGHRLQPRLQAVPSQDGRRARPCEPVPQGDVRQVGRRAD